MTHDINDLNTFATAYQDNAPQGDGLCRINWLNGDPGSRTPGAFFVTRRRIEDHGITVEGSPWREIDRTFRSGSSESGYEARALKLAVLGVRQHDVIVDTEGVMTYIPRPPRGAPKPNGWSLYVEVLVMAQGLDTPVVWSSKRIKTTMGLVSMLREYRTALLEPFRRERKNPGVPSWAFWLPVRGEVDAKQPAGLREDEGLAGDAAEADPARRRRRHHGARAVRRQGAARARRGAARPVRRVAARDAGGAGSSADHAAGQRGRPLRRAVLVARGAPGTVLGAPEHTRRHP